jgi:hypothetical protein
MRAIFLKRRIVTAIIACIFLLFTIYTIIDFLVLPPSLSNEAKRVIRAFLRESNITEVTGGYWDHLFQVEKRNIAALSQNERARVYCELIVRIEMNGGESTEFLEMMGEDAHSVRSELRKISTLWKPNVLWRRKRIAMWLDTLDAWIGGRPK